MLPTGGQRLHVLDVLRGIALARHVPGALQQLLDRWRLVGARSTNRSSRSSSKSASGRCSASCSASALRSSSAAPTRGASRTSRRTSGGSRCWPFSDSSRTASSASTCCSVTRSGASSCRPYGSGQFRRSSWRSSSARCRRTCTSSRARRTEWLRSARRDSKPSATASPKRRAALWRSTTRRRTRRTSVRWWPHVCRRCRGSTRSGTRSCRPTRSRCFCSV